MQIPVDAYVPLEVIDNFLNASLFELGESKRFEVDLGVMANGIDADPDDSIYSDAFLHEFVTFVSVEKTDADNLEIQSESHVIRIGRAMLNAFARTEVSTVSVIDKDSAGDELPKTERALRFNFSGGSLKGWDLRHPDTAKQLSEEGLINLTKSVAKLLEALEDQDG